MCITAPTPHLPVSLLHLGRQIFHLNHLRRRHDGQPMANVFKLTHIARKRKLIEHHVVHHRDTFGLHAQLLCTLLQKVARQGGMSSRRSRKAGKRKRMTFRRWNKSSRNTPSLTRCSRSWCVAAITRTLALMACDHPRGKTCHRSTHAANGFANQRACRQFHQEQGAALGLLKAPAACGLRARKGTALVAKQFTLEQIFGNGARC